ncbi:hypothetical protein ScPMuIL_015038 [Solemya velum]
MAIENDEKPSNETPNRRRVPENLFKNTVYYIVGDISQEVLGLLNAGGAKRDTYLSEMVSHVIADDPTHEEYAEAKELFELPVVRSDWVILSVKCGKQLPKTVFAPEGLLFSGIVACPSKLEESDCQSVWSMLTYYGAVCQSRLDNSCTHLITSSTEGVKYNAASTKEDIKIVTPDWITDSITKQSKQDEAIYHPTLLVYPKPESESMDTALACRPQHLQVPGVEPMDIPRSPSNQLRLPSPNPVLDRRLSGEELGKNGSRPSTPSSAKEALARMVNSRRQLNARTPDPQRNPSPGASLPQPFGVSDPQEQRTLRNITNNVEPQPSISPVRPSNKINQMLGMGSKLSHPPPPYSEGSSHHAPPPPYTSHGTLYGHENMENVPPDMCLLGCVFYITDYHKIVGQDQINTWKQVILQYGGQVDTSYSNRITHVLCASQHSDVFQLALRDQRRVVSAFWLNDVLLKKKMLPPWQALHLPQLFGEHKPCTDQIICVTNFDGEERTRVKQMITSIGAMYTGYMTHSNSVLVCKSPNGLKYEKAREWRIPVVNVHWLSDMVLGNLDALKLPVNSKYLQVGQVDDFHIDTSRISHLLVGWLSPLKISKDAWKKLFPSPHKPRPKFSSGQENIVTSQEGPSIKKARMQSFVDTNSPCPRVLFTGFPKGTTKKLQGMVEKIGGVVVEDPCYCTHLVAQSLSRTMKFFLAISVCKCIVTRDWVEESFMQKRFLDEEKYFLRDVQAEQELKCNLVESVVQAQTKVLFQGLTFYISPSVVPPPSDLKAIVESAGGTVIKKRPAAKTILNKRNEMGNPTCIVITCANDIHLCRDLLAKKIALYNAEFILTGVLRQEVDYRLFQINVH